MFSSLVPPSTFSTISENVDVVTHCQECKMTSNKVTIETITSCEDGRQL